eukprot:1972827-Pleurochrysis_carterae.AAC.1
MSRRYYASICTYYLLVCWSLMSDVSEFLQYHIGHREAAQRSFYERRAIAVLASVALRRLAVRPLGHVEAPTAGRDHTQ